MFYSHINAQIFKFWAGWYEESYTWYVTLTPHAPDQSFLQYTWYMVSLSSHLFPRPIQQLILTKTPAKMLRTEETQVSY